MSRAKVKPGDRIQVTAPSVIFVGEHALVTHVNEDEPHGTNTRVKVAPEVPGYQHPATVDASWNYGHLHFKKVPNEPANDDIPADEMLLAEAIAEAKGRGLKWMNGQCFSGPTIPFKDFWVVPEEGKAEGCCALGALALRDGQPGDQVLDVVAKTFQGAGLPLTCNNVYYGNDCDTDGEQGQDLGRAFRHAMTDDEPEPRV